MLDNRHVRAGGPDLAGCLAVPAPHTYYSAPAQTSRSASHSKGEGARSIARSGEGGEGGHGTAGSPAEADDVLARGQAFGHTNEVLDGCRAAEHAAPILGQLIREECRRTAWVPV